MDEVAKEILKLDHDIIAITRNAIKSGIDEGLIRSDVDPVEMTVFLNLIAKGLTEMSPRFKKVLEKRGITQHQFFADAADFMHHMLMNPDRWIKTKSDVSD
ncbi:hypothetical protein [Methanosarcina acetivorans]|nr:hypothetical protein [Methanosarcina acetivorans]